MRDDFAVFVDGEAAFAGGWGDAAEVAAWVLAVGFCPLEGVFGISEVVGEHCIYLKFVDTVRGKG